VVADRPEVYWIIIGYIGPSGKGEGLRLRGEMLLEIRGEGGHDDAICGGERGKAEMKVTGLLRDIRV